MSFDPIILLVLTDGLDALRARLSTIPEEIERETGSIRARYDSPKPRMFPVAVTLLVPERLATEGR